MSSQNTKERRRVFFHKGDVVKLRVLDMSEPPEMIVKEIVWETNQDGSIVTRPTTLDSGEVVNNKVLKGVICGWYSQYRDPLGNLRTGEYIEKLFDTRELVKVNRLASYYGELTELALLKEQRYDLAEEIRKLLKKI
jgi:hypothetical protein